MTPAAAVAAFTEKPADHFLFNLPHDPDIAGELALADRVNAMSESELDAVLTDYTLADKRVRVVAQLICEEYERREALVVGSRGNAAQIGSEASHAAAR